MNPESIARALSIGALALIVCSFAAILGWAIRPAPPMLKTTLDLGCHSDGL